ncbi:hypothetical protein [Pseudoalteromonas sp. MMG013]|nr:hypothetical protein [Pseudoalteromonas sp. MMG013]
MESLITSHYVFDLSDFGSHITDEVKDFLIENKIDGGPDHMS